MCGIAGWINWQRDLEQDNYIVKKMTETMVARGPDGAGVYISPNVLFGHRRLSVMDPANGAQPMVRYKGEYKCIITYNGELYNTTELKQQLEAKGYKFQTTCDTEVLLISYIEWGTKCVEKFNGIFAFAIWDEAEQVVFLARDRIGVKPLFYTICGNNFIFGSEVKALLAHPEVKPEIGIEGLAEIFIIGPARTPGNGIFHNMQELKPGYSIIYRPEGIKVYRYWGLESMPHTDDFDTTVSRVRELLYDAVTKQLVADVPVCTLLSGGLDSSALTAIAAKEYTRAGKNSVNTYSVDYVDNDLYFKESLFQPNSDKPWIKRVSEHFGTIHNEVILSTEELADSLPQAAIARDFPGMVDIDSSLYLFCRDIKKGATVALSGECADEVFGGYPWFYRDDMIYAKTFPWSPRPEIRNKWLSPDLINMINPKEYLENKYRDALAEVPKLEGEGIYAARMREIFYLSLTRWMPTLLDRKDRMSMAFGLEIRVPFCDHRLVEYVWNVPWSMKNYQNREKGLLRQSLTGVLPDDVLWRRKSPYPKTHNPAYLNIVRTQALDILQDSSSLLSQLVNVNTLREIANSDLSATNIPWFGQLMGGPQLFAYLIQIDTWLREYKVQIV